MDTSSEVDRWLFIGRWQPLHAGHKTLIGTALDEGHSVAIGIRDTQRSDSNPFSYRQRKRMFRRWLRREYQREQRKRVKIVKLPDLAAVVIGRNVGYKIIHLDSDMQAVSGTEIREQLRQEGKL